MIKKFLLLIFYVSSLVFCQSDIDNAAKYTLGLSRNNIRAGEVTTLTVDLKLMKDYYVYSSHPEKSLSESYIEWQDSSLFNTVGILQEPTPKTKYDPMFKMDIGYHVNQIKFSQDLKISENIQIGLHDLQGTFIYQVCDPTKCIPHWDDFSINLKIEPGDANPEFISLVQTEFESVSALDEAIGKGLLSFILFAMGMGFLALLTPCVFPMIPITVSFFTKIGEKENSSPLLSAIIYTLGIIIIFTGLGLILALTLGASGANQLAANPWINLFIAALFIYFAFSLFGHYEIQLPSALRQFSVKQEERGGVLGILFMAMTFTLTSFTCTVQFVGLLLVAASQGEFFWPILGMIAFSMAFASPFFFLALFPQYLAKLPKSGGWLNSVKVTMGFLELGAAMKFISNTDLVWQWGIFTREVVLIVWIILSIMMGIYLLGKIKFPHDSDINYISMPRLVLSIVFISFGIYLSGGIFGQPIHGLIDSYLPPDKDHLPWINDFEKGLAKANEENKPLFIDFTGYTCTNCRWMETNVFVDSNVQSLFNEFVLVQLFTDSGPNFRENQQMEIDRFSTAALPFYVVLSPENIELAQFPGMDSDVNKFIKFLKDALIAYEENNI